jgi:peptide/nickel transport system permease protein
MSVAIQEPPGLAEAPSRRRGVVIWQVIRERPAAAIGTGIVLFFVAVAIFAPFLQRYGVHEQVGPVFEPPSSQHWLGLDDGGIDMVDLLIEGTRTSLIVGFAAAFVATFIGGGVGIVAGYFGGGTDMTLMRITDYFLVIPDVPLMIVVAAIWGPSLFHIIVVIGILLWTGTARIVRAQVMSVRERTYVRRARSLGAGHTRLIFRHVLPQVAPLLVANVVLTIAIAIFDESALAFLGLGDPTKASWGTIIEHAFLRTAVSRGAWWAVVPPGVCIALVIMGCYLLGQAIEDALNPRLRVSYLSVKSFRLRPLVGKGPDAV